jgi:hypothetical protein
VALLTQLQSVAVALVTLSTMVVAHVVLKVQEAVLLELHLLLCLVLVADMEQVMDFQHQLIVETADLVAQVEQEQRMAEEIAQAPPVQALLVKVTQAVLQLQEGRLSL